MSSRLTRIAEDHLEIVRGLAEEIITWAQVRQDAEVCPMWAFDEAVKIYYKLVEELE